MSVDMKGLKSLQTAAGGAWNHWIETSKYVFQNHAGYAEALKAGADAKAAYQAVFDGANAIINTLAADPSTDPSWFDASVQSGPVWLRNNAQAALVSIDTRRKDVLRDLAGHFQPFGAPGAQLSPEVAAAAADAAAKGKVLNPNALNPSSQSNQHPPADVPPAAEMSTTAKVGLFGALGLAALWLGRKVL